MTTRPLTFNDYIGQERIKQQLRITIGAAKANNTALPHMLFSGGAGLGKTTVAKIIANEMGGNLIEVMATSLNTVEDVEALLAQLDQANEKDVLFIDEIHRLPTRVEEMLYPVMEDFIFEIRTGNNTAERFWVPKFTLIGATTLAGDLSQPLRDRFGAKFTMVPYTSDETAEILKKLAMRNDISYTDGALYDIARRSKGVARIAINFFNRCKEYADFVGEGEINEEATSAQFELLGVDEMGLDENDYAVLTYLGQQTDPTGLDALVMAVGIDKATISNIVEPYLIKKQLVVRTPRGRAITDAGLNWLTRDQQAVVEEPQPQVTVMRRNGQSLPIIGSRR